MLVLLHSIHYTHSYRIYAYYLYIYIHLHLHALTIYLLRILTLCISLSIYIYTFTYILTIIQTWITSWYTNFRHVHTQFLCVCSEERALPLLILGTLNFSAIIKYKVFAVLELAKLGIRFIVVHLIFTCFEAMCDAWIAFFINTRNNIPCPQIEIR